MGIKANKHRGRNRYHGRGKKKQEEVLEREEVVVLQVLTSTEL
jgi:hypothetical protein